MPPRAARRSISNVPRTQPTTKMTDDQESSASFTAVAVPAGPSGSRSLSASASSSSSSSSSAPPPPTTPPPPGVPQPPPLALMLLVSPIIVCVALPLVLLLGLVALVTLPCVLADTFGAHPSSEHQRPSIDGIDTSDGSRVDQFQNSQGLWIFTRSWVPAAPHPPRGVVFVCHGLGEHVSRAGYATLARRFVERGFAVHAMDHQGHGRSTGIRCHVQSGEHLLIDFEQFMASLETTYPATCPRFLFGHSMGGLLALHVALRRTQAQQQKRPSSSASWGDFTGVILSAPAVYANPAIVTPVHKVAARVLSLLFPRLGLDALDARLVSRNPTAVAAYQHDPLVYHGKVMARFGASLLALQDGIPQMVREQPKYVSLTRPLLLLHGTDDWIVPPSCSAYVLDTVAAPSTRKRVQYFTGAYHEVFEDPDCSDAFFSACVSFCEQQLV